ECRKRGVDSLKVVYSEEEPLERETPQGEEASPERGGKWNRLTPASNAIVPATAGLLMASEIIRDLTEKYR
ncbi:MAG: tRNA threonylcarbamoyladenosine dehydratase, partial [Oscillospiraceae bacterium]|nr:tRNA threonylcarbamoyladenosine dehydratase [Oscillospiraceae bacterium]